MERVLRREPWVARTVVALSLLGMAILGLEPEGLAKGVEVLLFAVPAVLLLVFDWSEGGSRDNDFALPADIALVVTSAGLYPVLIIALRRIASMAARNKIERSRSAAGVAYALGPPVVAGLAFLLAEVLGIQHQLATVVVVSVVYVAADLFAGVILRADSVLWRWALPSNVRQYGLLWVSQVSIAGLGLVTVQSLGWLSVVLVTLLAVLLRFSFALVQQALALYTATAQTVTAAVEAALPDRIDLDQETAQRVYGAALRLGLPEADADRVKSAAWLDGLFDTPSGSESDLARMVTTGQLALAESLAIVEAERDGGTAKSQSKHLGSLLRFAKAGALDCADAPDCPSELRAALWS